jgi:hypothetical protein
MALDPSIILAGRAPDIIGSIDAGNIAGQRRNEFVRTNALNAFLQESGPGIMSGDQNALAGFARFDPVAAMGVQDQRQQMAARAQSMTFLSAQERRAVEAHGLAMTAAQRAQAVAEMEQGVAAGLAAQTPQEWDAIVTQFGATDLVGQFGNREAIAMRYMSAADALKRMDDLNAPPDPMEAIALQQAQANLAQSQFDLKNDSKPQETGFIPATPEQAAQYGAQAGQFDRETNRFYPINPPANTETIFGPDGRPIITRGPGGGTGGPISEMQSKLQLFGTLMDITAPVVNEIETTYDPANLQDAAAAQMGWGGNYMRSGDAQRYEAAASAWADGALRLSTGAAATKPEIERVAATYFAVPGDEPETVAFKRRLREAYAAALIAASGGTFVPGQTSLPADPNAIVTVDPIAFAEQAGAPTPPVAGQQTSPPAAADISQMSLPDLLAFDLNTATVEEIKAWQDRFAEVGQ